jgi:hypothetical protein
MAMSIENYSVNSRDVPVSGYGKSDFQHFCKTGTGSGNFLRLCRVFYTIEIQKWLLQVFCIPAILSHTILHNHIFSIFAQHYNDQITFHCLSRCTY